MVFQALNNYSSGFYQMIMRHIGTVEKILKFVKTSQVCNLKLVVRIYLKTLF